MHWVRLKRFNNSCKQSSHFESKIVRFWSPVNSPFETFYLEVKAKCIYVIAVKIEPPFESKQQQNDSVETTVLISLVHSVQP